MTIKGLNGVEYLEASYRNDASVKSITKVVSADNDTFNSGIKKYLTDEQKFSAVTADSESQDSNFNYDIKLLVNTPVSSLVRTNKVFQNQISEKDFYRVYSGTNEDINDNETDDAISDKIGKGFYIVLNSPGKSDVKKIKEYVNPFIERVKTAYGLVIKKEPGMLVDLTY
jgi:hypothetical protein